MALLTILLALLVERFVEALERVRRHHWLLPWSRWWRERFDPQRGDGAVGLLLVLAPPLLLVVVVGLLLSRVHDVLAFLFALAVLVYAIGPVSLPRQITAWRAARLAGEQEAEQRCAAELLGSDVVDSDEPLDCVVARRILVEAHARLLGPCLWFVVLGPFGALLYRLGCEMEQATRGGEGGFAGSARRLRAILDWPAARLSVIGYLLAGSYSGAMAAWRGYRGHWLEGSEALVAAVGQGALAPAEGGCSASAAEEAHGLIVRSAVIWLVVLALLVLAGIAT